VLYCLCEPGGPNLIEALRDATRSRHESLASSPGMSRLFECDYTIAEYRVHLERLLGSSNLSKSPPQTGRMRRVPHPWFADRPIFVRI
jgi:hypothetical protein